MKILDGKISRQTLLDAIYKRLDQLMQPPKAGEPKKHVLNEYQKDRIINGVLGDLDDLYESPDQPLAGYIESPMGTGKTVMMGTVVKPLIGLVRELADKYNDDAHILILAPNAFLCEQIRDELTNPHKVNIDPQDVGLYVSKTTPAQKADALTRPVVIMTFAALRGLTQAQMINLRDFPIVQIDEVDLAKGEETEPLIRELVKSAYVFGWTATGRTYYHGRDRTVGELYFNGRKPAQKTSIVQAIANGESAPTRNIIFEWNSPKKVSTQRGEDYSQEELDSITLQKGRDEAAIDTIDRFVDPETGQPMKDLRQIWYCNGVAHAEKIASQLCTQYGEGYAVAVSRYTPKKDRLNADGSIKELGLATILQKHRSGEIPVLTNASLIIRGFDAPGTQCVVNLVPTRSYARAAQRARCTRIDRTNPDKIAYIIDFLDKGLVDAVAYCDIMGASFIPKTGPLRRIIKNPKIKEETVHQQEEKPYQGLASPKEEFRLINNFSARKIAAHNQDAPEQYVSAAKMAALISTSEGRMAAFYAKILEDELTAEEDEIFHVIRGTEDIVRLPREDLLVKPSAKGPRLFIHAKHAENISGIIGEVRSAPPRRKDADFLSKTELPQRFGITRWDAQTLYDTIQKAWEHTAIDEETIYFTLNKKTYSISRDEIGLFHTTYRPPILCVNAPELLAEVIQDAKDAGYFGKGDSNYLRLNQMADLVHAEVPRIKALYAAIGQAKLAADAAEPVFAVSFNNQIYQLQQSDTRLLPKKTKNQPQDDQFVSVNRACSGIIRRALLGLPQQYEVDIPTAEGMLTLPEMGKALGAWQKLPAIYKSLKAAYLSEPQTALLCITHDGTNITIPREDVCIAFTPNGKQSFRIHERQIPTLAAALKPRTDMQSVGQMAAAIAVAVETLKPLYALIQQEYERDPKAESLSVSYNYRTLTLRTTDIEIAPIQRRPTLRIHESQQPLLATAVKLRDDMASINAMSGSMAIGPQTLKPIYQALCAAYERDSEAALISATYNGHTITLPTGDLEIASIQGRQVFRVHQRHQAQLEAALDLHPKKPVNFGTVYEAHKGDRMIKGGEKAIIQLFKLFRNAYENSDQNSSEVIVIHDGIAVAMAREDMGLFRNPCNGHTIFCINHAVWPELERFLNKETKITGNIEPRAIAESYQHQGKVGDHHRQR